MRDNLMLIALALLCLAGVVLGVGGMTLLKRDRSSQDDEAATPVTLTEDAAEKR